MPIVFIPPDRVAQAGGLRQVSVVGSTAGAALAAVEASFPGSLGGLYQDGRLKPGLMLSIDGQLAALGSRTPVATDSEIHILPALGGG